jgi:hypothetical protein
MLDEDTQLVDEGDTCNDKAPEGNKKRRSQFGRRRTHNEQLCVAPCGVIVGRKTFFASEGVRNVVVSLPTLCLYKYADLMLTSNFGMNYSLPKHPYHHSCSLIITVRS